MFKKIVLTLLLLSSFFSVAHVFAEGSGTTVIVTEKMPWMSDCVLDRAKSSECARALNRQSGAMPGEARNVTSESPECRRYKCTIKEGFGSVMDMLGGIIKYTTFIVALLGVLALVWSGIEMSLSGVMGDSKKAKERIGKIVLGLVVLFLVGFILNSVAPWIYQ